MMNSNQYEELIVRYLANDVSVEEKEFAENWINASEQNRAYFEEIKKAWQLSGVWDAFRKVNIDDRWNHFKETVATQDVNEAAPLTVIEQEPEIPKRITIRTWLYRAVIAASILFAIGLVWLVVRDRNKQVVVENTVKEDSTGTLVKHEINTTGKEKRFSLPDGSLVVLADKSEFTYREAFSEYRHIALTGKAWFKVAKDTAHPFTVSSGAINTTALGTEFLVTAFGNTDSISVRLYEGKVVVKAAENSAGKIKKAVYLLPGQEFIYDGEHGIVKTFKLKQAAAPEQIIQEETKQDNPRMIYDEDANWYTFHNQSLETVLQDLAALHNVKILYNKKDIQHIDFTGKYNKSDSLETILNRIGLLNNLKVTKKDSAFILSKQ